MERKNYYLSDRQLLNLGIEASGLGISISEVLRRIIDSHYEKNPVIATPMVMFSSGIAHYSGIATSMAFENRIGE